MTLEPTPPYPLVSLVCFCRNAAATISRCIDAALAHDYPNVEVVVQDGASTDGTLEILRTYGDRIRLVSEPDKGPNDAMCKALRRVNGEIFAFTLADEQLMPHAASWAVQSLSEWPQTAAVYGPHYATDIEGNITGTVTPPAWDCPAYLCSEITPPLCSSFFSRRFYEQIAFDQYTGADEFDLWINLGVRFDIRYVPCPLPLAKYAVHGGSVSFTKEHQDRRLASRRRAIEKLCTDPATPEWARRLKDRAIDSLLVWHADSLCCLGLWEHVKDEAPRAFAAGPNRQVLHTLAVKILRHAEQLHRRGQDVEAREFINLLKRCNVHGEPIDTLKHVVEADCASVADPAPCPSNPIARSSRRSDMPLRFLIINTDYEPFLARLYAENPGLEMRPFEQQYEARMATCFGVADFYSKNLRALGHEAADIIYNAPFMQYAWARENGLIARTQADPRRIAAMTAEHLAAMLQARVRLFKPDIIINLAMEQVTSDVLNPVKPFVRLIVGQHAAPLTMAMRDLSAYDLLLSSIPGYVDGFRRLGKPAEYFRLGFESTLLDHVDIPSDRPVDVAFVGQFTGGHKGGTELFNALADRGFAMNLHGFGYDGLSDRAREFFKGPLFGLEMYRLYSRARVVLNRHIDIAGPHANNMRLYEATGMGALLLTDRKDNLHELFAPGREVVAYESAEHCAELLRHFLDSESERAHIAAAGQERTLREHTYRHRMAELAQMVQEYTTTADKAASPPLPESVAPHHVIEIRPESTRQDFERLRSLAGRERFGDYCVKFNGLTIYCHDLLSFYMAAKDIFLQRIYDFETDNPRPVIIDGGGHIGLFSLYAAQRYPDARITIFEPDGESLELLHKNLRANNVTATVVDAGLHKSDATLDFSADHSDGGSLYSGSGDTKVRVVPLSRYIEGEIDFLKLNIEGAETDVVAELADRLRFVRELVIEYHGFPETGQNLHRILASLAAAGLRYMIHDFDGLTNPATKPPFRMTADTRFFLLIYAKRLLSPRTADARPEALENGSLARLRSETVCSAGCEPVSRRFGYDLGTPIDRVYIERFLAENASAIRGIVLEIGDDQYSRKCGSPVARVDVLSAVASETATLVGDLATGRNIPSSAYDCIILTQTLQMIYDVKAALRNAAEALKPGGTLLLTASGISQISRYDMDRWGEYWRFTDKSLRMLLDEVFPEGSVNVQAYGNVAAAKAFLDGVPAEQLSNEVFAHNDPGYQVLLAARATKAAAPAPSSGGGRPRVVFEHPLILLYHRVADDPVDAQLLAVSPENFDAHMAELAAHLRVVPLPTLVEEIRQGCYAPDTVAVTFDDGYADNLTKALPILKAHDIPATVFVTSRAVGSDREFWWDALEQALLVNSVLPPSLALTCGPQKLSWPLTGPAQRLKCYDDICSILRDRPADQIDQIVDMILAWAAVPLIGRMSKRPLALAQLRCLAGSPLIEIGAHTQTHTRLGILPVRDQFTEVVGCKRQLEALTGQPVNLLSYPFGSAGDFTDETRQLAASEGFTAALANTQGHVSPPADLYAISRLLVRNWTDDVFARWLRDPDKSQLEGRTLAQRPGRIIAALTCQRPAENVLEDVVESLA